MVREALESVLNVELTEQGWTQASLPVSCGGLGIRSTVALAPSAFLASATRALNLISVLLPSLQLVTDPSLAVALSSWQLQVGPTTPEPSGALRMIQKAWDTPCCETKAQLLLDSAPDETTKARLLASREPTSGAWLKALPLSPIGLKLDNDAILVAVGLRLGCNICEPHVCACGAQVDAKGCHGLACKSSAGRHTRHSQLNDIIWRALHRAQVPATKEPLGLSRGDGKRPDGITMIPWARGRSLAWDVTVPDTLAPSHVFNSAQKAGSAAVKAEASKSLKYASLAQTHHFIPLAMETLGAWGPQCSDFISEVGRRITRVTGEPKETAYLKQRLSIAIQRGNAISCRGTLPQEKLFN